jgi:dihydropteroate synthase
LNQYDDVVTEVATFLRNRAAALKDMGVASDAIVLDPGFGFAKDAGQNLEMLRRIDEFVALGYPLLVGTSRKSFIGQTLGLPEDLRLEGTIATVIWAIARGARMVRVHDVEEVGRALKMVEAIENGLDR